GIEREGLVRVRSAAAGGVVADELVVQAEQLIVLPGRWLDCEDDVGALIIVKVEEVDLELAGDVWLVVNAVVECKTVDLDCAVSSRRVARGGGGGRPRDPHSPSPDCPPC